MHDYVKGGEAMFLNVDKHDQVKIAVTAPIFCPIATDVACPGTTGV